jgi:hypothetical protein
MRLNILKKILSKISTRDHLLLINKINKAIKEKIVCGIII